MDIISQMWGWCMERKIYISAEHLLGKLNTVADQESRVRPDSSEWKLNPSVFQQLMSRLGPCKIDLFVSRLTTQLPEYFSWKSDPNSVATNALDQNRSEARCYAFPPFALIGRYLAKVNRERVPELVLIAPVWPTQPWFPFMISILIQQPILLPNGPMLLGSPRNETHPLILQGSLKIWPHGLCQVFITESRSFRWSIKAYPYILETEYRGSLLGDNKVLTLKDLTHKFATIMALANASCASEIHALNVKYVRRVPSGLEFNLAQLTKTSRPGKQRLLFYPCLEEDGVLCPVVTLQHYLECMQVYRKSEPSRGRLFLAVVRPFKPVQKVTITR